MRIGLLNNLRAGRSNPEVRRILRLLDDYPDVAHVETTSVRSVPEALASLARQDVELLVVNGGDGTLQYTLTQMLTTDDFPSIPMVAPLRGGRTNMTAMDLGAHRNPVRGLQQILKAADSGSLRERVVSRPIVRVASSGREQVQYGMFFGAGIIHRAISLVHRIFPPGKSQGAFGASVVTAALIAKMVLHPTDGILTPDKAQIVIDRERAYSGEFYMLIASSLQRLFSRLNPYWGQGPGGMRFTSLSSSAHHVGRAVAGVARGKPRSWVTPEKGYVSANAERVELRLDCGFTIDGEIFEPIPDEVVTLSADRRVTFVRA